MIVPSSSVANRVKLFNNTSISLLAFLSCSYFSSIESRFCALLNIFLLFSAAITPRYASKKKTVPQKTQYVRTIVKFINLYIDHIMYNFGKPSKDPYNFSLTSKPAAKQPPSTSAPLSKTTAAQSKTAASKSKMVSTDFQPQRFGINYNPPTIVLEYLQPGNGKLYHHKMKLIKLKKDTPTKHALDYLKKKHYQYFFGNKIPEDQLIQLIDKLKKRLASQPAQQQRPTTASTAGGTMSMSTKGQSMFRPQQQLQEEEEEQEEEEDYYGDDYEDDEEGIDEEEYKKIYSQMGYDKLNMNKLTNEELQQHKAIMETMYAKNSVKPGDAGFMYDIQKNFQPQVDNEWDMEDDDDYDIV